MKHTIIILAAFLGFVLTACTDNEPEKETTVMKNEECLICGAPLEMSFLTHTRHEQIVFLQKT